MLFQIEIVYFFLLLNSIPFDGYFYNLFIYFSVEGIGDISKFGLL